MKRIQWDIGVLGPPAVVPRADLPATAMMTSATVRCQGQSYVMSLDVIANQSTRAIVTTCVTAIGALANASRSARCIPEWPRTTPRTRTGDRDGWRSSVRTQRRRQRSLGAVGAFR